LFAEEIAPKLAQALVCRKAAFRYNGLPEDNLVAGAGFEPAVRRVPDYEFPVRLKPVIA